MNVEVRYFARVREVLGRSQECVELPGENARVADLVSHLRQAAPAMWGRLPEHTPLLCAVNQHMVSTDAEIRDGDEVALFPPVTGG